MLLEIYPYLLVALIGSLAHILQKLAGLENLAQCFSLKIWWRKNKYKTFYGLTLTALTIVLLYNTKELNWASAIFAGYTGDSIIKTKLGISTEEPIVEDAGMDMLDKPKDGYDA